MTDSTTESPAGNAVEKRHMFDPADLRAIGNWDDAIKLLAENDIPLVDATTEIGDGFVRIEDKDLLIKVGFVLMAWVFTKGDFGEDYCIMRVVTQDGKRYVVVDGGTGVNAQIKEYETRTGRTGGMIVRRGLRKSEYFLEANGQPSPGNVDTGNGKGSTYYLNV